ncbi:MAG: protein kinase [Gammaproteobacteria bacterium]|nr:protein kinase [Gammaproteobacteria bacterium]
MKVLIIDDSADYRALLGVYLAKEFPRVEVIEYDPVERGRPGEDFDWSAFDILLLDYKLGETEDGLEWLKTYRRRPGFPPTVILTAEGDEYVAVRAVKLGAAEYINKKDVSPKRLKQLVEEAANYSEEEEKAQKEKFSAATEIVERIRVEKEQGAKRELGSGYRFVRLIGQGAMSQVYLAERSGDGQSVVLKLLDLSTVQDETQIQRFIQEAELIAGLHSPFVVKIYEHGLTQRYGFIAMEFFPRGDLKQRMELRVTPEVAFNYMTHVAYGLDAIHGIGVVHRDLKPANIMFRGDDSLALADFGISKKMHGGSDLTTIGQVLGTPHYMSPEQGEGKLADHRADLYSTGVMLYELLTGHKPYTANTPAGVIYQHVHAELPTLPPTLAQFQHILDRTLAKDPAGRYRNAKELIQVLEAAESACR